MSENYQTKNTYSAATLTVMELVSVLATGLVTLFAVWIGSHLSQRTSEKDWVREKRGAAYLQLLDSLVEIHSRFGISLMTNKFNAEAAILDESRYKDLEAAWHERIDDLGHLQLRVNMLGGNFTQVYEETANGLIVDMMSATRSDRITEQEWESIILRGHKLISELVASARRDLGIVDQKVRIGRHEESA